MHGRGRGEGGVRGELSFEDLSSGLRVRDKQVWEETVQGLPLCPDESEVTLGHQREIRVGGEMHAFASR